MANLDIFEKFTKTAYRVEIQSTYKVSLEQKNYNGFINGEPLDPNDNMEWINSIRKWKAEGKEIKRIRVIDNQLSQYEKYEFICYHKNNAAGEEIGVISRAEYMKLANPLLLGDFWIFDNNLVAKLIYDDDGNFLKLDVIEENEIVMKYSKLFRDLSKNLYGDYKKIVKQINNYPILINFDK